ncbi:hypothetical protein KXV42_009348 [Aspergillus fumigatus]|nr:hypothetical protein KXV42_009348 [Aspergillus fumigatus]KAH3358246.1 hypothetical protein KXW94_001527 [Aspergillus fumigatus]
MMETDQTKQRRSPEQPGLEVAIPDGLIPKYERRTALLRRRWIRGTDTGRNRVVVAVVVIAVAAGVGGSVANKNSGSSVPTSTATAASTSTSASTSATSSATSCPANGTTITVQQRDYIRLCDTDLCSDKGGCASVTISNDDLVNFKTNSLEQCIQRCVSYNIMIKGAPCKGVSWDEKAPSSTNRTHRCFLKNDTSIRKTAPSGWTILSAVAVE